MSCEMPVQPYLAFQKIGHTLVTRLKKDRNIKHLLRPTGYAVHSGATKNPKIVTTLFVGFSEAASPHVHSHWGLDCYLSSLE